MKRQYNFNLIEIVLAVAVVAFGVVIVLGMLPKGLTVTQNAATVSYASSVIDQIGGALLKEGTAGIKSDNFNNSAKDADDIIENYTALAEYIDDREGLENSSLKDKFQYFSRGMFKYKDADDVYVVVMGDSREIAGERENRLDFSGMIRVCKKSDVKTTAAVIKHSSSGEHECFDEDGNANCVTNSDKFEKNEQKLSGSTVYIELSYPLSQPWAERTKVYYSFDVK